MLEQKVGQGGGQGEGGMEGRGGRERGKAGV